MTKRSRRYQRYGYRRTRVPYFIVIKRNVKLHSASNFRHGYMKAVIRAHSATLRVAGVTRYHGLTRYLVHYRGKTGYVTTNRAYVRDAYYAPRRHQVRAIVIRSCWLHHSPHFSYRDRHAIKHLNAVRYLKQTGLCGTITGAGCTLKVTAP